jgi:lantibiotic leader peptide-processing serine protease
MHVIRTTRTGVLLVALVTALTVVPISVASAAESTATATKRYVVVYADGASAAAGRAAVVASGARIVKENAEVGVATVETSASDFTARANAQPALLGAARDRKVGQAPDAADAAKARTSQAARNEVERLQRQRNAARRAYRPHRPTRNAEPYADLQWDMKMMHATVDGSYRRQPGSKQVLVGILDTGVDGTHPDIAPNFDLARSRNFTTDIPDLDGPCEHPSCVDPANEDDDGHGTHVAGTVAAPLNGFGMAGVAPNVTIVNIRAGQDSGYFFLQPTVDALTYAGDIGIDVVNMSYYIDPWLFNCAANPADSPAEQAEQRTIIAATQRALDYARRRGVTLISATGNEETDLGHPTSDDTSPDYPVGTEHERTIDNSCLSMPTEAHGVIGVASLGPSGRNAYYSNYGVEQTDVSAPGGDYYDVPNEVDGDPAQLILAPYPANVAAANGDLNPDGTPNNPFVLQDCHGAVCGYYQYLQGTSMASPHAVGVAALIVSQFGRPDRVHGGKTLAPLATELWLEATAIKKPCPTPATYEYPGFDGLSKTCEGPVWHNGFYGAGVTDALNAIAPGSVRQG